MGRDRLCSAVSRGLLLGYRGAQATLLETSLPCTPNSLRRGLAGSFEHHQGEDRRL